MRSETLTYFHEDVPCQGWLVYDERVEARRPAILVAHAFRGQDEFARRRASELAELGYVALAVDIYGEGKYTESAEQAASWMAPFFLDRKGLQERMIAAVNAIESHPKVEQGKIGAMGFCFGGLAVYELLRSRKQIAGVVVFHGVLSNEKEGQKVREVPIDPHAKGHLLILHGHDDPMGSVEDLDRVAGEMTEAGIDWQIHIYGHTMHAFTNPAAADPENGCVFQQTSAKRAFRSMQIFFAELFGGE